MIVNIVMDSNSLNPPINSKIKPGVIKRRPYHGKASGPELPFSQHRPDQPIQSFQSAFDKAKPINGPNGFRTSKTVHISTVADDDVKEVAKKHNQDDRLHFITDQKTNALQKKIYLKPLPVARYDGNNWREREKANWKVGEAHWKPKALLPYLQPAFTVILGESKGKKDYFRAFTTTLPKPPDRKDRTAELLPYRMKKTTRLYGVSPLLLLKKSKFRIKSATQPKDRRNEQGLNKQLKSIPKKEEKVNTNRLNGPDIEKHSKSKSRKEAKAEIARLNGPEIEPNFGDENEFDFVEAEYFAQEPE